MDTEVNQTILGFAHTTTGAVSLTPISAGAGRRVVVAKVNAHESVDFISIPEPFHDSNKMYASIRGAPSDQIVNRDLEDFGCEENMVLSPHVKQNDDNARPALKNMMGAGWISENTLSDENTRVCIAVHTPGSPDWSFSVGKAADVFGNDGQHFDYTSAINYLSQAGFKTPLPADTVLLPMTCPLRVVTPQGVVFVG